MPELDGEEEGEKLAPESDTCCIAEDGTDRLRECPLVDALVPDGGGVDVRRYSDTPDPTPSIGLVFGAEIWRPG